MVERAIREGWEIDPRLLRGLPDEMAKIVIDRSNNINARINAARVIVAMAGQNQADRHHSSGRTVHHEHDHRLLREELLNSPEALERARQGAEPPTVIDVEPDK